MSEPDAGNAVVPILPTREEKPHRTLLAKTGTNSPNDCPTAIWDTYDRHWITVGDYQATFSQGHITITDKMGKAVCDFRITHPEPVTQFLEILEKTIKGYRMEYPDNKGAFDLPKFPERGAL